MKVKFFNSVFLAGTVLIASSCNEAKFLEEIPLDFYSPENSYTTAAHFDAALVDLYARTRAMQSVDANANQYVEVVGTDVAYNAREDNNRIGDYNSIIVSQGAVPRYHWENWYKLISNANTILSRISSSELTESRRGVVEGETKLFRAWAYRHLVHLYGGVPLVLDEVASPKRDFVRASREEVLNQVIQDATDAAALLPNVDAVTDGKLNKSVANHLLAETYIVQEEYDKAIEAATEVIERSNLHLMTERFGSLRNSPGDVYYDLFRVGNQNRGQGNTEAIWVAQYETDVIGGGITSAGSGMNQLERVVAPAVFSIVDADGQPVIYANASASTLNIGGRGVSFVRPTNYYLYDVWGLNPADDNRVVDKSDIRTSAFNIVRDFINTNPNSRFFGQSIIDFRPPNWLTQGWRWYPFPSKVTTPGQHPEGLIEDPIHMTLKTSAGSTYRDMYLIRLPETLLLRAEAYLRKGNTTSAAADLNMIRNRAKAEPVAPGEVTIEFILDERARELMFEENRRLTLQRLGKLVERVRQYNPLNSRNINDFHNLFPVPFSEIEANREAVLQQNPGYN